ncbi:putative peroxidase [Gordonia araii NBRC 100433]|uniref:Deferrochelatase n=1 Tax=Gordonia araii NBRC 100433 TaxID=1073574 RepID=G7H606_9ACTN|nr:iron uptake transporter deferrochelatase/peroxidase subunit [Gordonia araii]NNG96961.1 deferrochelatase/peroxidase EfeB [Gordonia araii NBRC 100433]GAB11328.1 putative peroxidase [Gordonia araii NBRC 100433]
MKISRRTAIGTGAATAALAGAAVAGGTVGRATAPRQPHAGIVPFRGDRQAGIVTEAQDRLHFVAFDVVTTDKAALAALLRRWTAAAERMTRGEETTPDGAVGLGQYTPPSDTGEALGLPASNLTLTIGFGPGLFGPTRTEPDRPDRFGLASRRPAALVDLPAFPGERIDPKRSFGDICIQACADDPQVAVHAVRNLARMGFGVVAVRWSQLGFGRTSSTTRSQDTPRNLFGFKDGTANLRAEDESLLTDWVWVGGADNPDGAQWMKGGTYLVTRRIRMDIEPWDRANLLEQEQIIGREKGSGAPLGQDAEFDEPNFEITANGSPMIPLDSHVRLSHPDANNGTRLLRRGYNFTDGSDGFGHLDAGLFFIAFCRDPGRQFVPLQRKLMLDDALTEYLIPNGSAVFACPPGLAAGQSWGHGLFD